MKIIELSQVESETVERAFYEVDSSAGLIKPAFLQAHTITTGGTSK